MSATELYDRFYDKMSEKQLNDLLDLIDEKPGTSPEIRKHLWITLTIKCLV